MIHNPHVDIIAHPSGRIVGGRAGADYDWAASVFAAAARRATALEINAGPDRLDPTDERAREAAEAGITSPSTATRTPWTTSPGSLSASRSPAAPG